MEAKFNKKLFVENLQKKQKYKIFIKIKFD